MIGTASAIPRRRDYALDLVSGTPTLNRRYGTGAPDDFSGPVGGGGLLTWTGTATSGGDREVYWPPGASVMRDAEVRSRWEFRNNGGTNQAIGIQHGHAHRIIDLDGTQASFLSITRNIFNGNPVTGDNMNVINFHWWQGVSVQFQQFGSVTLTRLHGPAGSAVDFPWNVKSRVVDKFFEFAIWLDTDPEPRYGALDGGGNPFGGGLEIPSVSLNYGQPGAHGVYMAHAQNGERAGMSAISAWKYP